MEKWLNIVIFSYTGIFIAIQVALMVLSVLDFISSSSLLYEFNILVLILTIVLNVNMTVFYCRNAGSPYLDPKARKKVHSFAVVVGVWTVAFVFRFVFNFTSTSILAVSDQEQVSQEDEFWFSVE